MITLPKTSFLPTIPAIKVRAKMAQLKWHKNTQENHPRVRRKKGNNASGSTFQTFLFGVLVGALATYFLPILLQNNNATTELPN